MDVEPHLGTNIIRCAYLNLLNIGFDHQKILDVDNCFTFDIGRSQDPKASAPLHMTSPPTPACN